MFVCCPVGQSLPRRRAQPGRGKDQIFVKVQGTKAPVQLCGQKPLAHTCQLPQSILPQHKGNNPLGVAVHHMAHGGQHPRTHRDGESLPAPAAAGAQKHPVHQLKAGVLRLGHAADGAGVQQRLIPDEGEELELKDRLDQRQGLVQPVQRVRGALREEGEDGGIGLLLPHHSLQHLGKIGAKGHLLHVGAHAPEELQRLGLVEGVVVPVGEEGHLRVDQQLGGGRQAAPLPAAAPGLDRHLPPGAGEHGEDLIRFFIIDLPQDDPLCGEQHVPFPPFYVRGTSAPSASGGLTGLGLLPRCTGGMLRQRGGLRQSGGPEEFP